MRVTSLRGILTAISLLLVASFIVGCGGTDPDSSTTAPSANYQFQVALAKYCTDKKVDLQKLGYVRMTKAGIEQIGLESAKAKLAGYLEKLVAIQKSYAEKRDAISVPPALQKLFTTAARASDQATEFTTSFNKSLASIATPAQLESATKSWVQKLDAKAKFTNDISEQLGVPECVNSRIAKNGG